MYEINPYTSKTLETVQDNLEFNVSEQWNAMDYLETKKFQR